MSTVQPAGAMTHYDAEGLRVAADALRRSFPDGTIEWSPVDLGEFPPAAAVDVLHKAIDLLPETRASFVPAIHDVRRDSLIAAAVRWRQEGDYYAAQIAQQQLADAIDRYLGVA